jgi:hypothetical protein
MNAKYKITGLIVVFFIAIQFIPYGKDRTNPPVVAEPRWDSPKTRELFFRACRDCHSNETKWPGYSAIAPVSWLVHYDVHQGRREFNVSMWGAQKENEGDECAETVQEGEMPPLFYTIAHSKARLSENEKKEFLKGLMTTFGKGDNNNKHEDE